MEKIQKIIDFIKNRWQLFSLGFSIVINSLLIVFIINFNNKYTVTENALKNDIKKLNQEVKEYKIEYAKKVVESKYYEAQAKLYAKLAEGRSKKVNQIIYETNKDVSAIDSLSVDELFSEFTKYSNSYKSGLDSSSTLQ